MRGCARWNEETSIERFIERKIPSATNGIRVEKMQIWADLHAEARDLDRKMFRVEGTILGRRILHEAGKISTGKILPFEEED